MKELFFWPLAAAAALEHDMKMPDLIERPESSDEARTDVGAPNIEAILSVRLRKCQIEALTGVRR